MNLGLLWIEELEIEGLIGTVNLSEHFLADNAPLGQLIRNMFELLSVLCWVLFWIPKKGIYYKKKSRENAGVDIFSPLSGELKLKK